MLFFDKFITCGYNSGQFSKISHLNSSQTTIEIYRWPCQMYKSKIRWAAFHSVRNQE